MATAAVMPLASPSQSQQPQAPPLQERLVTWKELRRAYDFPDTVTAQG